MDSEDWSIPCSDEEIVDPNQWMPTPSEIVEMYEKLDKKQTFDMGWICAGRRSPSVHGDEDNVSEMQLVEEDEAKKPSEPNDFDFEDEIMKIGMPKITPRRRFTPASNTKRVATFDKVMFDIERYRKLDEMDKSSASPNLTKRSNSKLPSTAGGGQKT